MSPARDGLPVALAVVIGSIAIAACGSSSKSSTTPAASGGPAVQFADCMRTHGVPNFPDPSAGGGVVQIGPGSGINAQSPAFVAAQKACNGVLPGGGPGAAKPTERQKQLALQEATCMRDHGVSGFPDPTLTPPTLGGNQAVIGRDGLFFVLGPGVDLGSPAFLKAASACGFPRLGPR